MTRSAAQTIPAQKVVAKAAVTIAQTKGLWVAWDLSERICPLAVAGIVVSSATLERDLNARVSRLQKIARN